ncbi:MAG: GNAT family N-acetyltransferase [Anaerolineae bacterium]
MLEFALRRAVATLEDAESLAGIEAATLGDSDLTSSEMLAVLAQPNQYVYLAHAGTQCIGMLATFETPTFSGPRLELDMLGVAPDWRGQGVARSLVKCAVAEGQGRGCVAFRAVVATDNPASRRVFERCGLHAEAPTCHLLTRVLAGYEPSPALPDGWSSEWVADLGGGAWAVDGWSWRMPGHHGLGVMDERRTHVASLALLYVSTIAYAGYWVERATASTDTAARVAMLVAAEQAKIARLDEVGVLVPAGDRFLVAALDAGYDLIGDYDRMVMNERV